ncbi:MAG TPA: class I SAM-dependent methyltransferase [Verrucomicrobiae bacterium]|nr:class I SAM-dependent methyltransferase [Verrucomicrobiae bacterium]
MADYNIIQEANFGYRHLDPIPGAEELGRFYQSRYYDLLRKGGRAPDLQRLLEGGPSGMQERQWLREGLYTDITMILAKHSPGNRLLEVGCGVGEFLALAGEKGFDVVGTEPSAEAARLAVNRNLRVHSTTLQQFIEENHREGKMDGFDAVVLLHVLEHVPDPVETVLQCKSLLNSTGILCVQVPNDFTPFQRAAEKQINKHEWWVAVPDHINYFNFESLRGLLEGLGFDVVHCQGDFPMEIFLLMGDDYVGNPEVGERCHARRVRFDLALTPDLRQTIYGALAKTGIGRSCLMFARNTSA